MKIPATGFEWIGMRRGRRRRRSPPPHPDPVGRFRVHGCGWRYGRGGRISDSSRVRHRLQDEPTSPYRHYVNPTRAAGRRAGDSRQVRREDDRFTFNFGHAEAHQSRRVLTSTFRRRPFGNRSRKRRGPAAGRVKAGPGTRGFLLWHLAYELPQGSSSCRRNVHTEERRTGRNGFHTASPAVELTVVTFWFEPAGGSGSQYSHWPWSLQMRAWSFP